MCASLRRHFAVLLQPGGRFRRRPCGCFWWVFGEGISPPEIFKEDAKKKQKDTRHTFQVTLRKLHGWKVGTDFVWTFWFVDAAAFWRPGFLEGTGRNAGVGGMASLTSLDVHKWKPQHVSSFLTVCFQSGLIDKGVAPTCLARQCTFAEEVSTFYECLSWQSPGVFFDGFWDVKLWVSVAKFLWLFLGRLACFCLKSCDLPIHFSILHPIRGRVEVQGLKSCLVSLYTYLQGWAPQLTFVGHMWIPEFERLRRDHHGWILLCHVSRTVRRTGIEAWN